jgi:hypothetical protein
MMEEKKEYYILADLNGSVLGYVTDIDLLRCRLILLGRSAHIRRSTDGKILVRNYYVVDDTIKI